MALELDPNTIFNGVVTSVVVLSGVWALGHVRTRLTLLNNRLSLNLSRAELAKVRELSGSSERLQSFLLSQLMACFSILGIAMMYVPVSFMEGGTKWIVPGFGVLGLAIYSCGVYAIGMLVRVRRGEAYLNRQQLKISSLEARLSGRTPPEVSQG